MPDGNSENNNYRRLALGTAQVGMPYGVANRSGKIGRDETSAILNRAWGAGLDTLDTAIAYGDSEQQLGQVGVSGWTVITKLPPIPNGAADITGWVRDVVRGSLQRLNISSLGGLLLHRPKDLLDPYGGTLYRALLAIRDEGLADKIGVSVYGPDEVDALWPRFQLDLVQIPLNILDRRFGKSGWLTRLHEAGLEIHIRSIFLQGLLLMGSSSRPPYFNRWQALWSHWHRWLNDQQLSPMQACLGFALSQPGIERVVVGVDSLSHLEGILGSVKALRAAPPDALTSEDPDLINPSRWKLS